MKLKLAAGKFFHFPFHPFLFAVFPVLFLYAHNIEETRLSMTIEPIAFILAGTSIFLFLSNLVFRNWMKSAVFTSLAVLIFLSHGHVHNLIGSLKYQFAGFEFGTDDTLLMGWFLVVSSAFVLLLRTGHNLGKFTIFLNLVALLLVLQSTVTSVPHEVGRWWELSRSGEQNEVVIQGNVAGGRKPDIYYIILDQYSANRTLKDFYDFDNSEFTDFLRENGFYVAEDSFTNYPRSFLSLASSLNMAYHTPPMTGGPAPLIQDHELGKFLKSQGYWYSHLGSWADPTGSNPLADENFKSIELYLDLNEFNLRLVEKTAFAPVARKFSLVADLTDYSNYHRTRVLYQFDRVGEISKTRPSPKFVFAHIIMPHDPYVFGPNCEKETSGGFSIELYLSQLSCANILVKEMVEEILSNSDQPPVIVIQADEGNHAMKYFPLENQGYKQMDPRTFQERARILNSYYLPGVNANEVLYSSITPVNSFRLILNLYFGTELELLPDRSYIFQEYGSSPWSYNLDGPINQFFDVTDLVK